MATLTFHLKHDGQNYEFECDWNKKYSDIMAGLFVGLINHIWLVYVKVSTEKEDYKDGDVSKEEFLNFFNKLEYPKIFNREIR